MAREMVVQSNVGCRRSYCARAVTILQALPNALNEIINQRLGGLKEPLFLLAIRKQHYATTAHGETKAAKVMLQDDTAEERCYQSGQNRAVNLQWLRRTGHYSNRVDHSTMLEIPSHSITSMHA